MTSTSRASDKAIHLLNSDPAFAFLPSEGTDFVIVCSDARLGSGVSNPDGALNAFALKKDQLASKSSFFFDMLQLSGDEGGAPSKNPARIHVEERTQVVSCVLSAAMDPARQCVSACTDWQALREALHLAIKWRMDDARTGIFFAMHHWLFKMVRVPPGVSKKDIVDVLAEAVHQGSGALANIVFTLRMKASAPEFVVINLEPLHFSEIHFLEIGAAGCSEVAQTVVTLVKEGVLNS